MKRIWQVVLGVVSGENCMWSSDIVSVGECSLYEMRVERESVEKGREVMHQGREINYISSYIFIVQGYCFKFLKDEIVDRNNMNLNCHHKKGRDYCISYD